MLAGMRILYGVVGEGMGHAIRSRVVLEHLGAEGHEVEVVTSGRAKDFLAARFPGVHGIHGLRFVTEENRVRRGKTLWSNVIQGTAGLPGNIATYFALIERFEPEAVISDFESWTYIYAKAHGLPIFSIDNMQIINRCRHQSSLLRGTGFDFRLARLAVKAKVPGAYHYLVTTFFTPEVRKKYTSLVPPILRSEILAAKREAGDHVLVYQTQTTHLDLVPTLKKLPFRFRVYGLGREAVDGNVTLCAFSESGFVNDLRTARAVIAGGGFSLMSEAVALRVPMLSSPVVGQLEQQLNARYLMELGFGMYAPELNRDVIWRFLGRVEYYAERLAERPHYDNSMLFACLGELLSRVERGDARPKTLDSPALGKFDG